MKTNNMKNLLRGLVNEEAIPGLDNTVRVTKDSKKHNDEYQKEVAAKMKEYENGITGEEDDMEHNKVNATDKQKEYHDQMEIKNGMEMLRFAQEPNERFKERAEMAIKGDSKMGNKTYTGKWNPETGEGNGNTEPMWMASNKDLAQKHIADTKASQKKRDDNTPQYDQFGDDIELRPESATKNKTKLSIKEGTENPMADPNYTHFAVQKSTNQILNGWNYSGYESEELGSNKQEYFFIDLEDFTTNGMKKNDILITTRKNMEKKGIDPTNGDNWYKVNVGPEAETALPENNKIQENKIGMKRLRFKTPFNGVETALKVIPESYKQDDKEFVMTDGNETYKIRWEGSLTEGEAVVLESENAQLIQESKEKVMKLMNYNSNDVFGSRKAKDRVEENAKVGKLINTYKNLIQESENKKK